MDTFVSLECTCVCVNMHVYNTYIKTSITKFAYIAFI